MSAATQTIASLPPLQRRMAEAWLLRFQESWHVRKLKECMQALPPQSSLRTPLLLAMMERDLELSWKDGRAIAVADYLNEFPELGGIDRIPTELLVAEYNVRRQYGRADLADFAERYPTRIDDLFFVVKTGTALAAPAHSSTADVSQSRLTRRLELLRTPVESNVIDSITVQRLNLLRGEPHEELAPAAEAPHPPSPRDTLDPFSRPAPARPEPNGIHVVAPRERAWLDVDSFRDPSAPPDRPAPGNLTRLPAMPPPVFGRYGLEKRLGRSGLGSLYQAHEKPSGRRVVLRIPHRGGDENRAARDRFQREARAGTSVWHPLLCPILDVGEIDGLDYLAMPFVDGETLAQVLTQRSIWTNDQAVDLVAKLAAALSAAHGQGLIHRDLKPSNIILTPSETPIVVGFGQPLAPTGSNGNVNVYLAPERQHACDNAFATRADVFSLGVIFYQLLTASLPTVEGDVSRLTFAADLDSGLRDICRKAAAAVPDVRYGSMREFAAALEQARRALKRESESEVQLGVSGSYIAFRAPRSGSALRSSASTPLPTGGPPSSPAAESGRRDTYQQMQEIRQLSASYDPDAALPWNSPYRPRARRRLWRWIIPGLVAAAALAATVVVLSSFPNRLRQDPVVPQPDPAANDVELAAERARLLKGLRDPNLDVRRVSAERLREFNGDDVVAALAARVGDDYWPDSRDANGRDRAEALLGLTRLDRSAIPAALARAMHSENHRVRIWATMEVVHLADPKQEPVLIAALNDPDGRVRVLAADGLRLLRWDTPAVVVALSKRVTEPWVLRSFNGSAEDLSDPRYGGRDAAVEALIALSPDEAEAVLDKAVTATNSQYRAWASQVRTRYFGKKPAGP